MTSRLGGILLLICFSLNGALGQTPGGGARTKQVTPQGAEAADVLVKVDTRLVENLPVGKEIVAALQRLPYVSKEPIARDDWHLRLKPSADRTSISVERASGAVLAREQIANKEGLVRAVIAAAEREAAWRAVRFLENRNTDSKVKIELHAVPVAVEKMDDKGIITEVRGADSGKLKQVEQGEFSDGDYFQFEIKNTGASDAYLTIVDLLSDGTMRPLFPVSQLPTDNRIPADGNWHRIGGPYVYQITPPFGFELFKAIATAEPVNLSDVFEGGLPYQRHGFPDNALAQYFAKLPNAFAETNIAGNWATATLTFESVKQGSLYVLSVGVSKYNRPNVPRDKNLGDLNTENDVRGFSEMLREGGRSAFDTVNVKTLYDKEATRDSIIAAFQEIIARIKPRDTFVFQFSGHSRLVLTGRDQKQQQLSLIPFDYDPDNLAASGITNSLLQTLLTQIQARNQLVVLDSNFSTAGFGGLIAQFDKENKELEGLLKRNLWILGSAETDAALTRGRPWGIRETFDDDNKKSYGLLTYSLLKGMSGNADFNKDGNISIRELFEYARDYTQRQSSYAQYAAWFSGDDFVLVKSPAKVGRQQFQLRQPRFVPATFRQPQQDKPQEQTQDKTRVRAEIAGAPAPAQARNYERKGKDYALLIATDQYEHWPVLSNPVHDAETIADELRQFYGFEIDPEKDILRNPKKEDVFNALRRIKDRSYGPDDQLFIFFAGHGHYNEARKEGYLIFADSPALDRGDELCLSCDSYLSHSMLRNVLDGIKCEHIFVMLDACFSGTFAESVKRGSGDPSYEEATNMQMIQRIMQHKTRRYLTSGGKEYVPDGRPGQHSPFARRFIEALRSYGGTYGMLTINGILFHVERVTPMPYKGEFGDNDPGSDFVFVWKKPQQ